MSALERVNTLITGGEIPDDAEIVSENNKIVVISRKANLVVRIGNLANTKLRDDPHDLQYSHHVAWVAGESAPAVRPLHEKPKVSGEHIISTYPLLNKDVHLGSSRAKEILAMTRSFGSTLPAVEDAMPIRRLNVATYVHERLDFMLDHPDYDQEWVSYVIEEAQRMDAEAPFSQLSDEEPSLVHGDLKADNIVVDTDDTLKLIDLDAAARGPRLYDLASWRLRSEMGDQAPVQEVVDIGRSSKSWSEDAYRALVGWKAISSMSFTLRYEPPSVNEPKLMTIVDAAARLGGLGSLDSRSVS